MMQTPQTTLAAMYPHVDKRDHFGILGKENSQIDAYNKANAEQSQEQYITADEARKLGAGNFEVLCEDGKWRTSTQDCPYRETWRGEVIKYRAIKQEPLASLPDELINPEAKKALGEWIDSQQPETVETIDHVKLLGEIYGFLQSTCPEGIADEAFRIVPEAIRTQAIAKYVEPSDTLGERVRHTQEAGRAEVESTCQVKNLDAGVTETMTREAAKNLFAETIESCNWNFIYDDSKIPAGMVEWSPPVFKGIYTYKRKQNLVKLDGKLMTREAAIALWESKKDTCDLWMTDINHSWIQLSSTTWCDVSVANTQYQLREKPKKQISWKDVPVGVAVVPLFSPDGVLIYRGCNDDLLGCERINAANFPVTEAYAPKVIKLAPTPEQPWLNWRGGECPVPEGVMVEVTYRSDSVDHGEGIGFAWGRYGNMGEIIEYRITGIAKGYELK